jgi:ribosomal protein S18 acetylase RimI-like enzyme
MKVICLGLRDSELCRQAATLHVRVIHHGLLPLLGVDFLTKMYRCIAIAPESGVWALVDGDKFVGFIAGCASVGRTYRWLIVNCGIGLAFTAGSALFQFSILGKLASILLYPFRRRKALATTLPPEAELLAIAIDENEYGKGYGKQLVDTLEASLCHWGVREYRVLTNIAESKSNAFYRAIGFAPAGTIKHHALTLQVYKKNLAR